MSQLASHQTVLPGRLVAFPLRGNAYTECLNAALRDLGVEVHYLNERTGVMYDAPHPDGLENAMRVVRTRRYDGGAIQRHVQQFSWQDVARTMLVRPASKARASAALG